MQTWSRRFWSCRLCQQPIEFLERELIDIVERNLNKMFPVKQGEAVLIVMYDASSKQELDSAVEAAAEAALQTELWTAVLQERRNVPELYGVSVAESWKV